MQNGQELIDQAYDTIANECNTDTFEDCALKIGTFIQYSLWIYVFSFLIGFIGMILIKCKRQLGSIMWVSWILYNIVGLIGFALSSVIVPGKLIIHC